MKRLSKIFLSIVLIGFISFGATAQDFPTDAEPGKCYMKCRKDVVWKIETETVMVKEASKVLTTSPARYETRTESILAKAAYKKSVNVLANFKKETETILVKEAGKKLIAIPAKYETRTERKLAEEASTKWVKQKDAMCKASNSDECIVWCLVETPAQ